MATLSPGDVVTLKTDPKKKGTVWEYPAVIGSSPSGIFPIQIPTLVWVLWPDGCVSGERLADLHSDKI